VVAGNDNKNVS